MSTYFSHRKAHTYPPSALSPELMILMSNQGISDQMKSVFSGKNSLYELVLAESGSFLADSRRSWCMAEEGCLPGRSEPSVLHRLFTRNTGNYQCSLGTSSSSQRREKNLKRYLFTVWRLLGTFFLIIKRYLIIPWSLNNDNFITGWGV